MPSANLLRGSRSAALREILRRADEEESKALRCESPTWRDRVKAAIARIIREERGE